MMQVSVPPAISVVLPVYDCQPYLTAAVESILGQSFADFELIALDDGSTDGSGALLDDFARRDPRVIVRHAPNRGLVTVLNEGIAMARAPVIARMDGDDIAHPDRFRLQLGYMNTKPECHVLGSGHYVKGSGLDYEARFPEVQTRRPVTPDTRGYALAHPTVMMRRSALERVGVYRRAFENAEDSDLWLRFAEHYPIHNYQAPLLTYRIHAGQISSRAKPRQALSDRLAVALAMHRESAPEPAWDSDTPPDLPAIAALADRCTPLAAIAMRLAALDWEIGPDGPATREHVDRVLELYRGLARHSPEVLGWGITRQLLWSVRGAPAAGVGGSTAALMLGLRHDLRPTLGRAARYLGRALRRNR